MFEFLLWGLVLFVSHRHDLVLVFNIEIGTVLVTLQLIGLVGKLIIFWIPIIHLRHISDRLLSNHWRSICCCIITVIHIKELVWKWIPRHASFMRRSIEVHCMRAISHQINGVLLDRYQGPHPTKSTHISWWPKWHMRIEWCCCYIIIVLERIVIVVSILHHIILSLVRMIHF